MAYGGREDPRAKEAVRDPSQGSPGYSSAVWVRAVDLERGKRVRVICAGSGHCRGFRPVEGQRLAVAVAESKELAEWHWPVWVSGLGQHSRCVQAMPQTRVGRLMGGLFGRSLQRKDEATPLLPFKRGWFPHAP